MATLAMMVGGVILSVTAFTGSQYLPKYISGNDSSKINAERKRHDLTLEKYQADWQKYHKKKEQLENWQYNRKQEENQAEENFENVDEALRCYNSNTSR